MRDSKQSLKFNLRIKHKPNIEINIITHSTAPGIPLLSKPKIIAKPNNVISAGKEVNTPKCSGNPCCVFLMIKPTLHAAINNKNKPIPIPIPHATPNGKLRKIQERIPVTDIV